MNKTPALRTPLPQRVPFQNSFLLSTLKHSLPNSTVTKRTVEPPRRVPLKMDSNSNNGDSSKKRLTPAPPKRVNVAGDRVESDVESVAESVCDATPCGQSTTSSNFKYQTKKTHSRTSGSRAMENLPTLESLKKRLDFNCEGPTSPKASEVRDDRNDSFDGEASDAHVVARKKCTLDCESSDIDVCDMELEFEMQTPKMTKMEFVSAVNQQKTRSSKKLLDKNIPQPVEERKIFTPQSKPIFDRLRKLGEKSLEDKFDLTKAILKLLALQETTMKESTEVYQAFEKIREALLKKLELLHYAETLMASLFTNSMKGAFKSAMDVKLVQNLGQSVSAKVATRKEILTSKGNSDSKVTKGKIDRIAEKQSSISRLANQNTEGTYMKLRSMTNAGKKTEAPQKPVATTAKPKTSIPKPALAKAKAAPVSKIPSRSAPTTRKGKENVGKQSGLPVAQSKKNERPLEENQEKEKVAEETKGGVKEEGETADVSYASLRDLPTTPVTTRPVQRRSISDTRIGKLFVRDHGNDDKNNGDSPKDMSPL